MGSGFVQEKPFIRNMVLAARTFFIAVDKFPVQLMIKNVNVVRYYFLQFELKMVDLRFRFFT